MRSIKYFLATCLLISSLALGQITSVSEERPLKLDDLIAEALQNNPQLRAGRNQTAAARTRVDQVTSWDAPQLGVEFYQTPVQSFPNPVKNGMETDYFIQQMFPFPGKLSAMGRAAEANASMFDQGYKALERKILRELKSAYYELYLGQRRGEMKNMLQVQGNTRMEFVVPARGLMGFRSEFMTQTKGAGILHHNFHGYEPFKGEIATRTRGAVVALEDGAAIAYALWKLQERSTFFIEPGTRVYAGMVVGENSREQDLLVNVCKTKQLTNIRASGADEAIRLEPPRIMTLEQAIEWISNDEYVEVTPQSIRIRKKYLDPNERARMAKKKADMVEA